MKDTELDELLDRWQTPAVPAYLREQLRSRLDQRERPRHGWEWRLRWTAVFAVAAGTLAVGTSLVTDGVLGSDTFRWDEHTYLRRTKIVHPFLAKLTLWQSMEGHSTGVSARAGELSGSMYMVDRRSRLHYGYTWNAKPAGAGQYLFTVLPLDPAILRQTATIVQPGHLPSPAMVAAGSSFEVDLYEGIGVRIFDRWELAAVPLTIERRETPEQAAMTLTLTDPNLYVDGQFAAGPGGVRELRGLSAMVDLPGRGRFVLVLDPQLDPRYVPAGLVKGNAVEFESGGERFRIECTAAVATGGERPVYVLRQDIPVSRPSFASGGVVHPR